MGFTEVTFLFVFLPVSIIVYVLADKLFKNDNINNVILIVLSMAFYIWSGKESFFVFLGIVSFTYLAGLVVYSDKSSDKDKRRLLFPIVVLIGILVYYKYITFLASHINAIVKLSLIRIDALIVPIGLSFVVFESISYIVDIHRGDAKAGNFIECVTFLSLFPKLVSGPIVLWKDFSPQLRDRRTSTAKKIQGIDRIIIGYAKKAILADTFGAQIDLINTSVSAGTMDVQTMWLRGLLYFFQLYLDFSGYSDIAIGLCSIFGFDLKENFNFPYLSKSVTEFWRRWHISLGTWFREYVYIPLGGNRRGNVYLHLIVVFILTGMWHGSTLPFLAWGGWNAACVVIERIIRDRSWYKKIPDSIKWVVTVIVVYFSWILFSSGGLGMAKQAYLHMFVPMADGELNFTWKYYLSRRVALLLMISIASQALGIAKIKALAQKITATKVGLMTKRALLLVTFVIVIMFVVNSTYSPFMYMQF